MGDFSYTPASLTVPAGTAVTFVNGEWIPHTVEDVDAAGEIRSKVIKPRPIDPGGRQRATLTTPGRYDDACTFHPTLMGGTVIVTR